MKYRHLVKSLCYWVTQTKLPRPLSPNKRMTVSGLDRIVNKELLKEENSVITESLEISQLKPDKRAELLNTKANELSTLLVESNVISTLTSTSPLTLNYMLEHMAIRRLSPLQLIYVLNYMLKTKFAKTIQTTEAFKYLQEVIDGQLGELTPSHVNGIVNALSKSKSDREDLYSSLSVSIMENIADYDIRTISNIVNNYTNIARKVKGFIKFYTFMKDVISQRLYTENYTGKDLAHILIAFSKTYNMSPNFLRLLEERALHVIDRSNINFKDITIYTHTFYLNKSAYMANDLFDFSRYILKEHTKYLNMPEFLTILEAVSGLGYFEEHHFESLKKNVRKYYESMNLLDIRAAYCLFWTYIQTHEDRYMDPEYLSKEPRIYKLLGSNADAAEIIMKAFNALHKHVDISDVSYYLTYINFAIDHNSEESRLFVKNLRYTIKLADKFNKLAQAERTKIIGLVKKIKVGKIQALFLNSVSK